MKDKKEKKKKSHKDDGRSERKIRKKAKKEKKKREKRLKEQIKSAKRVETKPEVTTVVVPVPEEIAEDCGPSIDLMNRAKCPETKEQWDAKQSQIRRVVDPETGLTRLIKGDGEILEEIVTQVRHKQLNKDATRNDGQHFQRNTVGAASARKYH